MSERRGRVEIHVERLVLTGLDLRTADAEQLRRAVGAALTKSLATSSGAFDTSADARRRTTVQLRAGVAPAVTGAAIGRAVAATLVRAPRPGRS